MALVLALLHQLLMPESGTDLAAQLTRASFAEHSPFTPVDFSWYGGVHPFAYSLLSPWVMALLGVGLAGVLAAVAGAVLFARLVQGLQHPVAVSTMGGFFSVADIVCGRTTFALGAVALLGALLCRENHRVWAVLLAVLTALLSPVAAAFLGFCAALCILHRRPGGWALGIAATLPVIALSSLFPGGGVQPFDLKAAAPAFGVGLALAVLTTHPVVRTGAALYAAAVLVLLVHDDPFGSNVMRLGLLVAAPLAVGTVPRGRLLTGLVVGSLAWQLNPPLGDLLNGPSPSMAGVVRELQSLQATRVEFVPVRDHRESYETAMKVPIARGWGRQIDYRDNRLFYEGVLTADEYGKWIDDHQVDYVVKPLHEALDFGGTREADLLVEPPAWLRPVWQDDEWIVLEVLSPNTRREVVSASRTEMVVRGRGDVHLAVRWSRWLSVSGDACLARSADEVVLRFSSPGEARLTSSLRPRGHC